MEIATVAYNTNDPVEIMLEFCRNLEKLDRNLLASELDGLCKILDNLFYRQNLDLSATDCYATMLFFVRDSENIWLVGVLNDVLERRDQPVPADLQRPGLRTTGLQYRKKIVGLCCHLWSRVAKRISNNTLPPNNQLQLRSGLRNADTQTTARWNPTSPWNLLINWISRFSGMIFKMWVDFRNRRQLPAVADRQDLEGSMINGHSHEQESEEFFDVAFGVENDHYQNGSQIRHAALSMRFIPLPNEFFNYEEIWSRNNANVFGEAIIIGHNLTSEYSHTFADSRAVSNISELPQASGQFLTVSLRDGSEDELMIDEIDALGF